MSGPYNVITIPAYRMFPAIRMLHLSTYGAMEWLAPNQFVGKIFRKPIRNRGFYKEYVQTNPPTNVLNAVNDYRKKNTAADKKIRPIRNIFTGTGFVKLLETIPLDDAAWVFHIDKTTLMRYIKLVKTCLVTFLVSYEVPQEEYSAPPKASEEEEEKKEEKEDDNPSEDVSPLKRKRDVKDEFVRIAQTMLDSNVKDEAIKRYMVSEDFKQRKEELLQEHQRELDDQVQQIKKKFTEELSAECAKAEMQYMEVRRPQLEDELRKEVIQTLSTRQDIIEEARYVAMVNHDYNIDQQNKKRKINLRVVNAVPPLKTPTVTSVSEILQLLKK